ncbi:DUF1642 domain-containing protein [Streptococcus equinus]|uniref:DUF1642 domain-containing protein n=1 Tax=Streptococcus equinus TaxID=1335 RepID=UPI003BF824F5
MNKQELMRKMHEVGFNCKAIKYASQFDKGYNNGIAYAINLLDKLDEPEKPIVPQFVADWFEDREHNLELYVSNLCVNFQLHKEQLNDEFANWYSNFENEPIQTLVKMKLYGYEVEKEKMYRARHKLTGEYLSQNYTKTGYYHGLDHFHILKLSKKDWEELGVLDDKMYEIEEVKE